MRKVIFLIHMSLDGFVATPNGEIDWAMYDTEMESYSHELHQTTDTAIYGRVTYQMMEYYWPKVLTDPTSDAGAMAHARWLDEATKIVFSTTLESVDWKNTLLFHDHVAEEMTKIKEQPGKDLWLIGSPRLAQTFMRLGLIDEYRINVNPVMLGKGQPLFTGLDDAQKLTLLESRTFSGGVVALRYAPATL